MLIQLDNGVVVEFDSNSPASLVFSQIIELNAKPLKLIPNELGHYSTSDICTFHQVDTYFRKQIVMK
jgi:hypothetical protein